MSYWGSSSAGGTYSKAKNSLIPGYNPAGSSAANPSYVTYSTSNTTSTPNVSYPSASSYSKPAGKVTYYTQDWNQIKQAQYKATGRVTSGGRGRGRGSYNAGSVQAVHYCEICKITCGTPATYKAHLEGSKHLKKAAKVEQGIETEPKLPKSGFYKCVLCDITSTTGEAFQAHIKGSKHDKKVQLHKRLGKPIPDNITPLNPEESTSKVEKVGEEFVETKYDSTTKRTIFFCSMCNCSFMDATAKEFHIQGRRHRLEYKKKYDKTLKVDLPASKRQKMGHNNRGGRGGYRGGSKRTETAMEDGSYKEIWEAEQRQLESEWSQYREEERWYRYIEGIKRQEEEHRQWYIQERQRCERLGIAPPPPPPRPRPPPPPPARDNSRKLLNNHDANLIHTKHSQLQPSKTEIAELEKLMKQTEDTIELISEELDEEYMQTQEYKTWKAKCNATDFPEEDEKVKTEAAPQADDTETEKPTTDAAETPSAESEEKMEVEETITAPAIAEDDHLVIKSCIRIGDLPKHSIMKSKIEGVLAVFCVKKPTVDFFEKLFLKLKKKFAETEDALDVVLASDISQVAIFVKRTEPVAVEVKINLTSALFREEEVNENILSEEKTTRVLDRKACLDVLALLRQTKWFESRMSVSLIVVLQLLKDLSKRIPAWSPLSTWALELLVERCARTKGYSTQPPQFSPPEVLRRVFELFASGFLLLNSPGLNDPCEKEPVDVLGYLTNQEREDLSASAQYALRLMVYNQLYKILGIAQPPALKNLGQIPRSAAPSSFKQKS